MLLWSVPRATALLCNIQTLQVMLRYVGIFLCDKKQLFINEK